MQLESDNDIYLQASKERMVYSQKTADGSITLFSENFQETYHSRNGALTESQHVFIEAGLAKIAPSKNQIRLGEVGLGTGLNAILSYQFALEHKKDLVYFSVEAFPIQSALKSEVIAHFHQFDASIYKQIMDCHSAVTTSLSPFFTFTWYQQNWPDQNPFSELDILFYDAFAPGTQPELWTTGAFNKAFESLVPGGILVTYCAKGEVKRNLKAAGFRVESLPGPPGKREMTRATKP